MRWPGMVGFAVGLYVALLAIRKHAGVGKRGVTHEKHVRGAPPKELF